VLLIHHLPTTSRLGISDPKTGSGNPWRSGPQEGKTTYGALMDNEPKFRTLGLTDLWKQVQRSAHHRPALLKRIYNLAFHAPNFFVTLFPLSCLPLLPRGAIRHRRQNQLRSGGVVLLDCHVLSAEGLLNYPSSFYPTSLPSSCSD